MRYNAAMDYSLPDLPASSRYWYLNSCHELALNSVHAHDSEFSQRMSEIVLTFSSSFKDWAMLPRRAAAFT